MRGLCIQIYYQGCQVSMTMSAKPAPRVSFQTSIDLEESNLSNKVPMTESSLERIKMNEYHFPDNIPITDEAKELIEGILKLDPS